MTKFKYQIVYSPLQRRLHWWVAGLTAAQYAMQNWLVDAMERVRGGQNIGLADFLLTNAHMLIGASVAYLVVVRLRLRRQMAKANPSTGFTHIQWLALWVHRLLYAVLLGMVATGALHYYAGWSFAGQMHEWGKGVLGLLIATHLIGAAQHYWRQRA